MLSVAVFIMRKPRKMQSEPPIAINVDCLGLFYQSRDEYMSSLYLSSRETLARLYEIMKNK